MGGIAQLARAAGHQVSGSDQAVYPPMSDVLSDAGIDICEGYSETNLEPTPDLVIIGNAISRGNPEVEAVLNRRLPYTSGPRWLGENYLRDKRVIAVAGTHGKTTTTSMIAWILEQAGLNPGFLIGGLPANFGVSARDGDDWFVVEADEYDTAFFDKRAKFIHYRPWVTVLNNLEFDHVDIYPDLEAIETQFHHLVRALPGRSHLLVNADSEPLERVLERGCWTEPLYFSLDQDNSDWHVRLQSRGGTELEFFNNGNSVGQLDWPMTGEHNAMNALAAIAAVKAAGVSVEQALEALSRFSGVSRRQELLYENNDGVRVLDDFAHHPTAIRLTLQGLRRARPGSRVLVAMEPRSNSLKAGAHQKELGPSLAAADWVWLKTNGDLQWDPMQVLAVLDGQSKAVADADELLEQLLESVRPGDSVVFMSNGGFDGLPHRFAEALRERDAGG